MPTVAEFAAYLERFAPCATAAEWDNVGLLLGDPAANVSRVMTCLTVTPDVSAEAVREGVNLVVSHHPILFRGAKKLTTTTPDGQAVLPLLRAGIAVYSPHTAFDNCHGGINDGLCWRLGVANAVPLRPREARRQCKLVVFVPAADLQKVSDAVFAAGAGVIGQYNECSFRLAGTGTFYGTDSTNPTRRAEGPPRGGERVAARSRRAGASGCECRRDDAEGAQLRGAGVRRLPAQAGDRRRGRAVR